MTRLFWLVFLVPFTIGLTLGIAVTTLVFVAGGR